MMSIHFKGKCIIVQNVECHVPTETKWFKIQPMLRVQGWCKNVEIIEDRGIIT